MPVSSITDFIENPDLVVSVMVEWLVKLSADIFVTPLPENVPVGFLHCIDQWTEPSASICSFMFVQLKLDGFIIYGLVFFESGFIHSVTVFTDERFIGGRPAIEGICVVLLTVIFHRPGDNLFAAAEGAFAAEDELDGETAVDDELPPLQPDKIGIKTEINKTKKIIMIFFLIKPFPLFIEFNYYNFNILNYTLNFKIVYKKIFKCFFFT